MVKFDPEGFDAMMARIAAEEREMERQAATLRSPFEDLEPDYEYMADPRGHPVDQLSSWP